MNTKLTQNVIEQILTELLDKQYSKYSPGSGDILSNIMKKYHITKTTLYAIINGEYTNNICDNITRKCITEFPEYSVDIYGNVYGKNGYQMTPEYTDTGYAVIRFCYDKMYKKRIHRLVADAFIPNPLNLPEINHIDGNKTNNNVSNLEWCTRKYNMQHASTVLHKMNWSENRKLNSFGKKTARKLSNDDIINIKAEISDIIHLKGKWGFGKKVNQIADKYKVHAESIRNIINGKYWSDVT